MTSRLAAVVRGFAAFWWDFIVGDDWRIAASVIAGLAGTAALARTTLPAWWLLPAAVVLVLTASVWAAAHRRSKPAADKHDHPRSA